MGAMDHSNSDGQCIWCHGQWPCATAAIRRELAGWILAHPVGETGDADYDNGRESGMQSAADLINVDGE